MISTETTAGSGEAHTIHQRMAFAEELVEIVRSAECPIGLGHTVDDEALPVLLACLKDILGVVPVRDIVYYRSPEDERGQGCLWSLHTNRGMVLVLQTSKGLKTSVENRVDIEDFPMIDARRKLLKILGADQKFSAKKIIGRRVTLVGDYRGINHLVFVALEHFFQERGAREVEFVSLKLKTA